MRGGGEAGRGAGVAGATEQQRRAAGKRNCERRGRNSASLSSAAVCRSVDVRVTSSIV